MIRGVKHIFPLIINTKLLHIFILPLWKMQTDVSVGMMQQSSLCRAAPALHSQISLLISVPDREQDFKGGLVCNIAPVVSGPDVRADLHVRRDA